MAITAKLKEVGNGRKFTKKFSKGTRAQQVDFQKAVLAATVAVVDAITENQPIATADAGAVHAAGTYSDATLHFAKGVKTAEYPFEQLTNAVSDGAGGVNILDPLMTAIAAAYLGPDGALGWTLVKGVFKK